MEVSSAHQVHIFLLYVLAGVLCGAFFDLQRFLRRKIKAGYTRTCIEDFVFGALCVTVMIIISYFFNNGEIRYYQVMGSVSGGLFYGAFLRRLFMKSLNVLFLILKNVLWKPAVKIFQIILLPIVKITYLLKRLYLRLKKISGRLKRAIKKRKNVLKKRIKML